DGSVAYLVQQFRAGADAVQIFESFAADVPPALFDRLTLAPIRRIIAGVRAQVPNAPVIVFARGASLANQMRVAQETGAHAVGLDWGVAPSDALPIQALKPVQGNLDPLALVAGGKALEDSVATILHTLGQGPLIFNLGHGIVPQTPVAHVEWLVELVRG
ncbi:MAG: uroporphyrinogen decarboxylase family protein, partial [Beijerinckiaceae bacterium]